MMKILVVVEEDKVAVEDVAEVTELFSELRMRILERKFRCGRS